MSSTPVSNRQIRWLFLRVLGLTYLAAFGSLRAQLRGLYGSRGIAPIRDRVADARSEGTPWRELPSLFRLGASDRTLVRSCNLGLVAAALLTLNVAPRASLAALWSLYLSFVSAGGIFLAYQWDALLLETTVHALLLAPPGALPKLGRAEPPTAAVLLLRWLAFRLHRQSGQAKITSLDPTWRDRTACHYHFETQPLPTRVGWYVHQLPHPFLRLATRAVLVCERYAPFLAFAPRPLRKAGFCLLSGLQAAIALTGNYAFFNLLSEALVLCLLDDRALPQRLHSGVRRGKPAGVLRQVVTGLASALVFVVSLAEQTGRRSYRRLPRAARRVIYELQPLASINTYGLFSIMTTRRREIVIEASMDGENWREYEFRYKPGAVDSPPRWVAPHQPRLDWQMWFAALEAPQAWFVRFLLRLLEASPDVLALIEKAPFGERRPRYVRAMIYDYRETSTRERFRTGAWWRREHGRVYFPAVALAPGAPQARLSLRKEGVSQT